MTRGIHRSSPSSYLALLLEVEMRVFESLASISQTTPSPRQRQFWWTRSNLAATQAEQPRTPGRLDWSHGTGFCTELVSSVCPVWEPKQKFVLAAAAQNPVWSSWYLICCQPLPSLAMFTTRGSRYSFWSCTKMVDLKKKGVLIPDVTLWFRGGSCRKVAPVHCGHGCLVFLIWPSRIWS